MAKNKEEASKRGKVFQSSTRCDGLDARKVQKYTSVPKIGVRDPEAGAVIAKKTTSKGDVGSRANKERGEKATSKVRIRQQPRTHHGS